MPIIGRLITSFAVLAVCFGALLAAESTPQAPAGAGHYEFVTLGTLGGPMPIGPRAQPSNLLVRAGEAHLIDAGDGAATQMARAGAPFGWLRSVFVSHIHFDHIGGLYAVLGLRLQTRTVSPLTIYGPPGTREIVGGLIEAMRPSADSGFGVPGEVAIPPETGISVVELEDGQTVLLDGFTVRAAANSHYSFAPGSPAAARYRSFSYRFDLPGRSIVYTGDTGPSRAVETLARGADLLVAEMIDIEATTEAMRRRAAGLSPAERTTMIEHLRTHHLTTADIGALAQRAGVRRVVVTHLAGGASQAEGAAARYAAEIQRRFPGPVVVADDLDRF